MLRFSSKNIAGLESYSLSQRVHLIHLAGKLMPFWRRVFSNTLKVLLLIGVFWSILYLPGVGLKLLAILAAGLLYPLVLYPVTLNLALPYLNEAKTEYEQDLARRARAEDFRQQTEADDGSAGEDSGR